MDTTIARLNSLTVKALREIATRMGVKLLSRDRKAVIVKILSDHITDAHEIALQWDAAMANEAHQTVQMTCCGARFNTVAETVGHTCEIAFGAEVEAPETTYDAVTEAKAALDAVEDLASMAQRQLDMIPHTDARFDAAYQIWQDLKRCADELERTHYAISEGLF